MGRRTLPLPTVRLQAAVLERSPRGHRVRLPQMLLLLLLLPLPALLMLLLVQCARVCRGRHWRLTPVGCSRGRRRPAVGWELVVLLYGIWLKSVLRAEGGGRIKVGIVQIRLKASP